MPEAASGLWRSEDMVQLQIHMQREVAHDSVFKLGQLGMFQFLDLNKSVSAFQRDFAQEVRRCDDMERKLRFMSDEIAKAGVAAVISTSIDSDTLSSLERKVEDKEKEVRDLNTQFEALMGEKNRLREHLEVLSRELGYATDGSGGLTLMSGVIPKDKVDLFERQVFRITRGNCVIRVDEIAEPFYNLQNNEKVQKCVFAVLFSAPRLQDKLKKLCDVNSATTYPFADSADSLQKMRSGLRQQLESISLTLQTTANRRHSLLSAMAANVGEWRRAVGMEKAVYSSLNLLQFSGTIVVARGWCPAREIENIKEALKVAELMAGAQVATFVEVLKTKDTPPTYFKTNKIIGTFQGIVDSYGIARYKEVNPGVFTIVTFPYLFGVMYGDIGHGLILTLFASFLIFMEKTWEGKPLNEIFAMIFGGRYLLFVMGIFATYVGVLYNDMFGFSTEIFSSGYTWPQLPPNGPAGVVHPTMPNGHPSIKPLNPVVFGIDSAWAETENKLELYNSIKMKCAVIIGIIQMGVGVLLSLMNHLYYNDMLHVWFRFVPEIVFLSCTFGYMALLIVIKWCTTWTNTHDAPSLLETMTNFFLSPGTVTGTQLYAGQAGVQVILLLIAFSMVPVLLCVIPYMEKKHHEEKLKKKGHHHHRRSGKHGEADGEEEEEEDEHFDFSEIMIHQVIHTIEYVLGCVSNTASYLRLWALSLAHAQLSDVFWNFAFMMTVGLDNGSGIFVFIGFAVWICATIGVLLGMESLSAFLHSLRLHWVEFQNKFYYGDGIAFLPFDLSQVA
jgi:V-type H+-transporting ATPase subunit a